MPWNETPADRSAGNNRTRRRNASSKRSVRQGAQFLDVDRLAQVVVHAETDRGNGGLHGRARRQEHQRQVGRLVADARDERQALHVRHVE